jgi:hypothetical protein
MTVLIAEVHELFLKMNFPTLIWRLPFPEHVGAVDLPKFLAVIQRNVDEHSAFMAKLQSTWLANFETGGKRIVFGPEPFASSVLPYSPIRTSSSSGKGSRKKRSKVC